MKNYNLTDIPGYQGQYAATPDGHIWSYKSSKFLAETENERGYYKVTLYPNKSPKKCLYVHKLIALTYIPNSENKETIDHIDKNKKNNKVSNLKWATRSEQNINKDWSEKMQEAVEKGAKKLSKKIEQRSIYDHNQLIATYPSISEAARQVLNDVSKNSLISRCAKGKVSSAYGYWWCYANE